MIEHNWTAADGRKISKIVVIAYAPDGCEKTEMVAYSMGLSNFKDSLNKAIADARCINSYEDLTAEKIESWFKE